MREGARERERGAGRGWGVGGGVEGGSGSVVFELVYLEDTCEAGVLVRELDNEVDILVRRHHRLQSVGKHVRQQLRC